MEFSLNLVYTLIFRRPGLGLLISKFRNFFQSYLPTTCPYFRFRMITLINVNEFHQTWYVHWYGSILGLLMGKFRQFRQNYLPATHLYFSFRTITSVNFNGFSPNLICALILWRSGLESPISKFRQSLTELSARNMIMAGYYRFTFFYYIPETSSVSSLTVLQAFLTLDTLLNTSDVSVSPLHL